MKTSTPPPAVVYLAGPATSDKQVKAIANANNNATVYFLARRGYAIGWLGVVNTQQRLTPAAEQRAWQRAEPVFWPGILADKLPGCTRELDHSFQLYLNVLDGASCAEVLEQVPYQPALSAQFNLVTCSYDESDQQQVERLDFEPASAAVCDELDAEVWMKASWLSYAEEDASLRFRFSFGMDGYEDVAADPYRQTLTSQLAQLVFPESRIITDNDNLMHALSQLLAVPGIEFVERIVYFNAPDGGAQFHQDVERGHLGVIFAQLSGRTAWIALAKKQLIQEIMLFLARADAKSTLPKALGKKHQAQLFKHANDAVYLNQWLDQRDNDALDIFINQTPAFNRQLVEHGHAYILHPGDVLLLPQQGLDDCAWHSVFCLDEEPGEALSFAMKRKNGTGRDQ